MWFKKKRLYFDTAATTPLGGRVLATMKPIMAGVFGNPSSIHFEGQKAREVLEISRRKISGILGCLPEEVHFTSGGTESDNLALRGLARGLIVDGFLSKPGHIITTAIEHKAVLEPIRELERDGWRVTRLPVDENGLIRSVDFQKALTPDTAIISIMFANNEIGTLQPLREVRKILEDYKRVGGKKFPYLHIDACQAGRFFALRPERLGADLLTFSGSKIYGPKGVGILFCKRGTPCRPEITGGGQEGGLRAGTENVALGAGLARALEICEVEREKESHHLGKMRDLFIEKTLAEIPGTRLNGSAKERLPNNVNISFIDLSAEFLVVELDRLGLAASAGSACSAPGGDASYVIMALDTDQDRAMGAVRFSLPRGCTESDIERAVKLLKSAVDKVRKIDINNNKNTPVKYGACAPQKSKDF